jgi:hypothetical protein
MASKNVIASGGQASGFLRDCLELFKMSIGCSPEPGFCSYRVTAKYVDSDKISTVVILYEYFIKLWRSIGRALR